MTISGRYAGCAALALMTLGTPGLARAEGPICGRQEVLDVVAAGLAAQGSAAELEREAVGQVPGGRPGLVLCAVRVRLRTFDTNRSGYEPLYAVEVHQYYVRAGRNGFFVSDAGR